MMDQQAQKETKQQESKTFLVGEVFDTRYKIMSLIASGGMGELYHAIDQELQREVAIKVMRAEFCSSEDSRERFFKEAKALASLDHPNIVRIFRFGIDEWDEPFLVMEFVQGESLAQELARTGKLSPEKFLFVFTEVLNGLVHAHKNKLVHRDLKPGNIMISADSASAKIIDFGIAKTIAPQAADAGNQTKTNTMIGTPHYMSPEQCKGERGSKLSDIYSIACIMYEALSGHTLYQGDSAFEIMYKQMSEAPPRLLAAAKTEKEKTLAALIDRCLEKEPSRRPQSVEEIRDVFKELIAADLTAFDPAVKKPSHMGRAIAAIVIF
ncbi:MAG: serine/threonine protein kinase, partial [Cyanobacteria bacterium]|nr:serine/threonine protein kinase [Cyanobacteriota bacterium]